MVLLAVCPLCNMSAVRTVSAALVSLAHGHKARQGHSQENDKTRTQSPATEFRGTASECDQLSFCISYIRVSIVPKVPGI